MSKVVFYRCEKCGNMVALLKEGGGTMTCCHQEMTKLKPNTSDGATEKHVPDIKVEDGKIKVQIGSTLHPSTPEHYIEWIALVTDDKLQLTYLLPGNDPRAEFDAVESGEIYEYCNLHGLWKAEI